MAAAFIGLPFLVDDMDWCIKTVAKTEWVIYLPIGLVCVYKTMNDVIDYIKGTCASDRSFMSLNCKLQNANINFCVLLGNGCIRIIRLYFQVLFL